ncbi:MAG: WD40/YVTN/BNR-like repeat-containing protein [Polyangiales bacterium]
MRLPLFTAVVCILMLRSTEAAAHAPPQIWRVARSGSDGRVALLTNRGIIFGDAALSDFRFMCNTALGINSSEQPYIAFTSDGRLLASTSAGLQATTDGCSWQNVPEFGSASTPALAQDAAHPDVLYVSTFSMGRSGIEVSKDGGASWAWLTKVADNDFIQEIVLAPSSSKTLYYSGEVFDSTGKLAHYVARSNDAGATFNRNDVALLSTEADVTLLAVSPSDPAVLLARAQDGSDSMSMDRLLVSRDGGQTFSSPLTVPQLFTAAFAADGQTVWVASIAGLWRSRDAAATFQQVPGPNRMTFVAVPTPGTLSAGGWFGGTMDLDGWAQSSNDGDSFTQLMLFPQITEPVMCDAASSTAMNCEMLWKDWQYEILKRYDVYGSAAPPPGVTLADASVTPSVADAGAGQDAGARATDAGTSKAPAPSGAKRASSCAVLAAGGHAATHGGLLHASTLWLLLVDARARRRARMSHDLAA